MTLLKLNSLQLLWWVTHYSFFPDLNPCPSQSVPVRDITVQTCFNCKTSFCSAIVGFTFYLLILNSSFQFMPDISQQTAKVGSEQLDALWKMLLYCFFGLLCCQVFRSDPCWLTPPKELERWWRSLMRQPLPASTNMMENVHRCVCVGGWGFTQWCDFFQYLLKSVHTYH